MNARWILLIPVLVVGAGLSLGAQSRPSAPQPRAAITRTTPPLVVLVVADQFRADYVQSYGGQWTKGLRRLIDTGAYFPLAAYPYAVTVTCPGHTTISTGAFPRTHGMIGNTWYDRATKRSIACTQDAAATSVPFGGRTGSEQHSAKAMLTTTFADELRNQAVLPPHIASISLKARAAIGMVGHGGDLVVWGEDNGTWATSSAFAPSARPDVDAFARSHAIDQQYGRVWDRVLPLSRYVFADEAAGELKSDAGTTTFPHALTRPGGKPDAGFVGVWQHSPFVDEALTDMAITFSTSFGTGAGTDMLAVSFSALDLVGHQYGSKSHEVQDVLARLDVQLGRLFDTLDRRVGAGRYVVAFSADHGTAPIPEQVVAMGLDASRYTSASINTRIVDAWKPFAADGASPVASGNGTDIYFTPAALAILGNNAATRQAITGAVLSAPGIARAFWADELAAGNPGDDAMKRAEVLSYVAGRSADLVLVPKQYWMTASSGSTHGTPYAYDQRVPLALMGYGIRPGRYLTSATPADIAPTLALLCGITLPRAEGRPLTEAVIR